MQLKATNCYKALDHREEGMANVFVEIKFGLLKANSFKNSRIRIVWEVLSKLGKGSTQYKRMGIFEW